MKKVLSTILLLSILTLPSCDFLRKVAGRPDSAELSARAVQVQLHKKAIADSLQLVQEAQERESQRNSDSLSVLTQLTDMGIRISSKSRFGEPVAPLKYRYNLVIGVYRTSEKANEQMAKARKAGFSPYFFQFNGGVKAVCLWGADDLFEFALMAKMGIEDGACPKDAWIFERKN